MTPTVLRRIVSARISATVTLPLHLEYRLADPVPIRITLGACAHRRSWHVARDVIAGGLMGGDEVTDHPSGDVLLLPLPGGEVLMGLRSWPHGWLVTVPAADLERFLEATLQACPPQREAQIVGAELDVQCGFFYMTQGGNPA
ncbi:MAG: SsgA family sporulation/cell division regulator [Gammaproteobacteria bacterium]